MVAGVVNILRCKDLEAKRRNIVGVPYEVLGDSRGLPYTYIVEGTVRDVLVRINGCRSLRINIALRNEIFISAVRR